MIFARIRPPAPDVAACWDMGDVRWMFHATAMGPDYDAILDPLAHLFGCRVMHRWQQEEPSGATAG